VITMSKHFFRKYVCTVDVGTVFPDPEWPGVGEVAKAVLHVGKDLHWLSHFQGVQGRSNGEGRQGLSHGEGLQQLLQQLLFEFQAFYCRDLYTLHSQDTLDNIYLIS
jgi:hypothetical protein